MVRQISFLGLGFEVGQGKNGLALSPQYAKKYFSLLKTYRLQFFDFGSIFYSNQDKLNKVYSNYDIEAFNWCPYQNAFGLIRRLLRQDKLLVNWGGDHSVGIATVGAFCREFPNGYVVWIDAHADLNLPLSSMTGNLHGMPLSILLNLADIQKNGLQWLASRLEPSRLIYIGLRDLDLFEKDMIAHCGITNYDMNDIRKYGMATIAAKVAALIGQNPFHVSFDIDSVDPNFAPATGICVADGLTLGELELLGDSLLVKESLKSIDIVEVNPLIGSSQQVEKTYFAAFNFLKNIKSLTQGLSNNKCSKMNSYCLADPNQGGPNDAISRSNKTQHAPQMESSI